MSYCSAGGIDCIHHCNNGQGDQNNGSCNACYLQSIVGWEICPFPEKKQKMVCDIEELTIEMYSGMEMPLKLILEILIEEVKELKRVTEKLEEDIDATE